ncbi:MULTISPECIES: S26 family signal peptidase [unclassified Burkholderia]|uniref:S26 family signal peptidase n=1 Tax=unclassified Burkholderia TaxID=2613784 RepID=UPI0014216B73|nr:MULTISPECIES: S26 family signal peptidase [unclassified Burkholderia]NIE82621.1 S26 family signal peptidase [Burkholderia sp. Tr-860]NIF61572.1 S26 family signal peptidase [Burkholderia sp. Cy-647]NIF94833.1 S26 family signal peptidase [Burkholderia sp. Ax-1720]
MTAPNTTANAPIVPPLSRSRGRVRIVVATLAAVGFAALAWASFLPANMRPLPRLTYNPSDSVAVGWYRIDPRTDSLPRPLFVDSIVLVPLPATAAALAAQRGYLPAGVPLLKPVAAIAPQQVCISGGIVRIDGVPSAAVLRADRLGRPLPSWPQCRRLEPGELFLLSTTNPASFDSRYFGPVNANTVIGVAHPVWLETRQ